MKYKAYLRVLRMDNYKIDSGPYEKIKQFSMNNFSATNPLNLQDTW